MSFLDIVKSRLLNKLHKIDEMEVKISKLNINMAEKKAKKKKIVNKINDKSKEIRDIDDQINFLENIKNIYIFRDEKIPLIQGMIKKFKEIRDKKSIDESILKKWINEVENIEPLYLREFDYNILDFKTVIDIFDSDKVTFDISNTKDLETIIANKKYERILRTYENLFKDFTNIMNKCPKIFSSNPKMSELENRYGNNDEIEKKIQGLLTKKKKLKGEINLLRQKDLKEIDKEIKSIDDSVKKLEKEKKKIILNFPTEDKIQSANSIGELGYQTRKEATKALGITSKEYIVIPIPDSAESLEEVFNRYVTLDIDVNDILIKTGYYTKTALGCVNSDNSVKNEQSVLMVPIENIQVNNVKSRAFGEIELNMPNLEECIIIAPEGKKIKFDNIIRYNIESSDIHEQVVRFLGESYSDDSSEYEYYDIFKAAHNPQIYRESDPNYRTAVNTALFENTYLGKGNLIRVNGYEYTVSDYDESQIIDMKSKCIDLNIINKIISTLSDYLDNTEGKSSLTIEEIYAIMLKEYLALNRKSKAEYYGEKNTVIEIDNRKVFIKPMLPRTNNELAKKFTRKNEDITYKTMKLAVLCNKFAHLFDNRESERYIQEKLFEIKDRLISKVIELADDNPEVDLKLSRDEDSKVSTLNVYVPGYSAMALHFKRAYIRNKSQLERIGYDEDIEILRTPTIMVGGVNEELIKILLSKDKIERMKIYNSLDEDLMQHLLIRMGYTIDSFKDKDKRKKIIQEICEDEKLKAILEEQKELEL